jgi:hypothetical protein
MKLRYLCSRMALLRPQPLLLSVVNLRTRAQRMLSSRDRRRQVSKRLLLSLTKTNTHRNTLHLRMNSTAPLSDGEFLISKLLHTRNTLICSWHSTKSHPTGTYLPPSLPGFYLRDSSCSPERSQRGEVARVPNKRSRVMSNKSRCECSY